MFSKKKGFHIQDFHNTDWNYDPLISKKKLKLHNFVVKIIWLNSISCKRKNHPLNLNSLLVNSYRYGVGNIQICIWKVVDNCTCKYSYIYQSSWTFWKIVMQMFYYLNLYKEVFGMFLFKEKLCVHFKKDL